VPSQLTLNDVPLSFGMQPARHDNDYASGSHGARLSVDRIGEGQSNDLSPLMTDSDFPVTRYVATRSMRISKLNDCRHLGSGLPPDINSLAVGLGCRADTPLTAF
jgi:hypothetical protein